jgi:hypothetical protein
LNFVLEEDDIKEEDLVTGHFVEDLDGSIDQVDTPLRDLTSSMANFLNQVVNKTVCTEIDEKSASFMIYRKIGESNCGLVCWKIMKEKFRQLAIENFQRKQDQIEKKLEDEQESELAEVIELDEDGNILANESLTQ